MTTIDNPEWPWDREGIVQTTFDSAALQSGAALLPSDLVRHLFVIAASSNRGLTGHLRCEEGICDAALTVSGTGEPLTLAWSAAVAFDLPPKVFPNDAGLNVETEPDVDWMVEEIDYGLSVGLGTLLNFLDLDLRNALEPSESIVHTDRSLWKQVAGASPRARKELFLNIMETFGCDSFDEDLAEHFNLEMDDLADLDDDEVCTWLNKSIESMKQRLAVREAATIANLAAHIADADGELLEWSATDALVSFAWLEAQARADLDQTIAYSPEWVLELATITSGIKPHKADGTSL